MISRDLGRLCTSGEIQAIELILNGYSVDSTAMDHLSTFGTEAHSSQPVSRASSNAHVDNDNADDSPGIRTRSGQFHHDFVLKKGSVVPVESLCRSRIPGLMK